MAVPAAFAVEAADVALAVSAIASPIQDAAADIAKATAAATSTNAAGTAMALVQERRGLVRPHEDKALAPGQAGEAPDKNTPSRPPLPEASRAGDEAITLHLILLLGDSGVGKTCLLTRFTKNSFDEKLSATIGVDFCAKVVSLHDARVKLTIWDTAGQEKFRTLTSTFYRGAKGIILVFDVTRPESLADLERVWLHELELYGTEEDAVKMVVANKVDVGSDFAQRHGCLFVETSAKANIAVQNAFEELVLKILDSPTLLQPPPNLTPNATRIIQLAGKDEPAYTPGYCC